MGSKASVLTWEVTVLSATKGPVRRYLGTKADIPDYIRWDGKDDTNTLVPEGAYYATLAVDYGKVYRNALTQSKAFSVVMTPPTGSVTVDPPSVALADLGPRKPVALTVQAKSAFAPDRDVDPEHRRSEWKGSC